MMDIYESSFDAIWAALGGIFIFIIVLVIALIVFAYVVNWHFFKKCGRKGWEAIIPFYSSWVKVEIAGLNWWWFLLMIANTFVSVKTSGFYRLSFNVAALLANFVCNYNLAKKFHKDTGFAILMTLFPIIMIPIMAFSNHYQFDASVMVSKNGIFGNDGNEDHNFSNMSQSYGSYCANCGTQLSSDAKFCPNCGKEK